ncbi:NSP-interacting kinase 1-like protein, partial [Tanacetum coccineum]
SQDDDPLPCFVPNPTPELVVSNTPEHESGSSESLNYEQQSSILTTAMLNLVPPARRSLKASSQPVWLKDFVSFKHKAGMATSNNSNPKHPIYPLFQTEDFEHYPKDYKEGLDYKHTFSLVAKAATVRVLIVIATAKGWPLHQLDVNNAFLHGFVDEEIYMKSLKVKALFSLFVKAQGEQFTVVLVYVDDILLTGNSMQVITDTKNALDQKCTIKDLGLARYLLGIEMCNTVQGTYLHQRKYILDLLQDASLTTAKPTPFPLPQNLKLALNKGNLIPDAESYRRLVGRLLYLSMTRPDISYVVQHLSTVLRIAANPCYHERTKHLDIDSHFTRDKVQEGFLQTAYIPTSLQLVDIMTKALGGSQHSSLSHNVVEVVRTKFRMFAHNETICGVLEASRRGKQELHKSRLHHCLHSKDEPKEEDAPVRPTREAKVNGTRPQDIIEEMAQTIVSTMAGHKFKTEMATKESTSNTTTTEAKAIPTKRKKEKQAAGFLLLPRAVAAKEYPGLRGAIKALHATSLQILLLSIAGVLFMILRLQVDIILVSKVIDGVSRHGVHNQDEFTLFLYANSFVTILPQLMTILL